MLDFVEWLRMIIFNYQALKYLIIFLGTAIGGELALFTIGFFVAQGTLPVIPSIIFGFLGSFSPNILWFLLGKAKVISKIVSHPYTSTTISTITEAVTKISKGNHFIALIIAKFLIGTPLILVMYANKTGLRFKQFLYYETPAIILSMLVIIPIGFVAGLGFSYLADVFNNIYVSIGFILLVIFVVVMIQIWFKNRFTEKV